MKTLFKHFITLICIATMVSIMLTGCHSDDEGTYLVRETDDITFDLNLRSSKSITLRCNGAWHTVIPEGAEWISVSPSEGVGDGSFTWIDVIADDNRGVEREATVYLECGGNRFPITVRQSDGQIIYSDATLYGSLKQGEESSAQLTVKYMKSFGDETVTVRGTVQGGVEGIAIGPDEIKLEKGSGQLTVDIKGTPTAFGDITILVYVNDVEVGSVKTSVLKPDEKPIEDFPVAWNFCPVKGTADDKAELTKLHPEWLSAEHYCNSDVGNGRISLVEAPGKTAKEISGWGFNDGHIYFKGLYYEDYILFTIPVTHLSANTRLNFKGSIGGSGSAAAFFMIEYSTNGTDWTQAEGAETGTFNNKTFDYHIQAVDGTTTVGEKTGNFDKVFTVSDAISNGTLYIRLRVCGNVRVNLSSTVTNTGGGSNRLKGVNSISLAE